MKKILLSFVLVLFSYTNVFAQIDLGLDDPMPTTKQDKKEDKKQTVQDDGDKKDGIFSFMNFSFSGKKKEEAAKTDNPETFFEKTIRMAEEGDLEAQLTLGYLYLYGEENTPVDYVKSFRYYSMAAEQNDIVAINNLGSLYYSGIGTERNLPRAIEMFKKASAMGNSESSVNLAFIYLTGSGIRKDKNQAVLLFSKAAKEGNSTAQFMMGYANLKGFVVPKDTQKAFSMIKAAADANYADANYILAQMYLEGTGTTKNYGNAVRQFTKAALQGNVESMLALGEIYAKGKVYTQNTYQAHIWYNIASLYAAQGAREYRDAIEKGLKIEQILQAQAEAETYKEKPSEVTNYIRKTFGYNIKGYMDQ